MEETDLGVPDVLTTDLVVFVRPDVRLDEFAAFDTPVVVKKSVAWEWVESLAFTVVFVLIFTSYIAQATQVPTESMKPTILVGDHFFLDKLGFRANYPEIVRPWIPERTVGRGDILAFRSPTDQAIPFVKRVIAVGGDTVEIRGKSVYINGEKLDEPYKIHVDSSIYSDEGWTPEELRVRDGYGPMVVPPDSFFLLGDNRDNSNDSRFWGFVNKDQLIGKPMFVYWSYEADPYVPGDRNLREAIEDYASIAANFFTRTRWFRIGTMIR